VHGNYFGIKAGHNVIYRLLLKKDKKVFSVQSPELQERRVRTVE
jgi:hypothetical protein